jgi:hypothetical protein
MGAWIRIKYISDETGREVGLLGHFTSKAEFREAVKRYRIRADDVTYIAINGQKYAPTPENFKKLI